MQIWRPSHQLRSKHSLVESATSKGHHLPSQRSQNLFGQPPNVIPYHAPGCNSSRPLKCSGARLTGNWCWKGRTSSFRNHSRVLLIFPGNQSFDSTWFNRSEQWNLSTHWSLGIPTEASSWGISWLGACHGRASHGANPPLSRTKSHFPGSENSP